MRCLLFLSTILLVVKLQGQYAGGKADGFTFKPAQLQNQSANIYTGGSNDGSTNSAFTTENKLPKLFTGGKADGFARSLAPAVNPLPALYKGGNDDGFAKSLNLVVNKLPKIYTGGSNDGTGINTKNKQNKLPAIYAGGNNDGYTSATVSGQNIVLNIYTGSTADGYASIHTAHQNKFPGPGTLISFSGTSQQQDVLLLWQVSAAENIETFEIERSINNGQNFEPLAKMKPDENENSRVGDYTYLDIKAFNLPATNLKYRIKLLDKAGNFKYSTIITLVKNITEPIIAVYPNPTNGTFILQFKNVQTVENYKYLLHTSAGALLQEGRIDEASTRFNLSHLASATYILSIFKENKLIQNFTIILTR